MKMGGKGMKTRGNKPNPTRGRVETWQEAESASQRQTESETGEAIGLRAPQTSER